jgi:alanyl-tRNA synthetase
VPADLASRVAQLSDERRKLERELADARKQLALGGGAKGTGPAAAAMAGDIKVDMRVVEGVAAKDLKSLADDAKSRIGSGVVAFAAVADGKASLVVGVTDDLTKRISAVDLVKLGAEALGGKGGGGRPDMAQAGGPDGGKAQAALDAIRDKLAALPPA